VGLSLALAKTSCIWYGDKWVLGVTRVTLTLWGGVFWIVIFHLRE